MLRPAVLESHPPTESQDQSTAADSKPTAGSVPTPQSSQTLDDWSASSLSRSTFAVERSSDTRNPANSEPNMSGVAGASIGETIVVNGIKYVKADNAVPRGTVDPLPIRTILSTTEKFHEPPIKEVLQVEIKNNDKGVRDQHIDTAAGYPGYSWQSAPDLVDSEVGDWVGNTQPGHEQEKIDGNITWGNTTVKVGVENHYMSSSVFFSRTAEITHYDRYDPRESSRAYYVHYPIAEQLFSHKTFPDSAEELKVWGRVSTWPGHGPPPAVGFGLLLGYLYQRHQYGKVDTSTIQSWSHAYDHKLASLYVAAAYFKLETVQDQLLDAMFFGRELKQMLVDTEFIFLYDDTNDHMRDKIKQRLSDVFSDFLSDVDDEFDPWDWDPPLSHHQVKKLMIHMLSMNQELIDNIGRGLLEHVVRMCFERRIDDTPKCEIDDEDMTSHTPRIGPSAVAISRSNELCTLDFEVGEKIYNIQVVEASPFTAPVMSGQTDWGNGRFPANYVRINDDEDFDIKAAITQLRLQSPPLVVNW